MKRPTTRIIFDRKHAATKTRRASVQIEVSYKRHRKYIPTGVRVFADQFDFNSCLCCNSLDMMVNNQTIYGLKDKIDSYILELWQAEKEFTFEGLAAFLDVDSVRKQSFADFVERQIEDRRDLRPTTKRAQRKLPKALRIYGAIQTFLDLDSKSVLAFDNYLRASGLKATTVFSYHRMMKTYIHRAIRQGLLEKDPYAGLSFQRGESEAGRYLTEREYNAIASVELPSDSLARVRDIFIVQCNTGLSFSDLYDLKSSRLQRSGDTYYLLGARLKTGIEYCSVLLPHVKEILDKYGGSLPLITNQQYNLRLKIVAEHAGVFKPVASHWARRTCGMLLLNKGVSMEVVSRVLGHSSIKTTEKIYARLTSRTVVQEISSKLSSE